VLVVDWLALGGSTGRADSKFIVLQDPDTKENRVQIHIALRAPYKGAVLSWRIMASAARDPSTGATANPSHSALAAAEALAAKLREKISPTVEAPPPVEPEPADVFALFGGAA
jgi:hypothetical protein